METERLILREPIDGDAEALRRYYCRNEERFTRWEPTRPDAVEAHRAWIASTQADRRSGNPTTFLAFDRANSALVAVIALSGFSVEGDPSAMLSYTIDRDFEGQGYASEAVRCVIRYAANDLALKSVFAYYEPENVRSGRLLQRTGFAIVARTPVISGFERLMRVQNIAVLSL